MRALTEGMEVEALRGPRIVSGPPGPRSRELMELKDRYIAKGYYVNLPIFIKRGSGALIEDVDGNVYIDFGSGIGVLNAGHSHPDIARAISEQARMFSHACFHITPYEGYLRVAERLIKAAPGPTPKKAILVNSGAEAVENSIKIAIYYSKRPALLAFENAFHGRTHLAAALSSKVKPNKIGFGLAFDNIERFPYAYCYRCAFGQTYPDCGLRCIGYIEDSFASRRAPEEVAAVIAEPIQGEGGIIVPPEDFIRGLRRLCDRYGILFIADEIQTGLGRTGRMFACEHWSVIPDIMCIGKAIAGGIPMGVTVAKEEVMSSLKRGEHTSTFGGNPIACAAASATLDIIVGERLPERASSLGQRLMKGLRALKEKHGSIREVRGMGLMIGVEMKHDVYNVIMKSLERGLLILDAGRNVLRFLPPLVIEETQLDRAIGILDEAIVDAALGGASDKVPDRSARDL